MEKNRCPWCLKDDLYMNYHDKVWGVPQKNKIKLFEYLNLEGAQAGLSWYTVLKKIPNYKIAFKNWIPEDILTMTEKERKALYTNPGIIRNRLKIDAVFQNASSYMRLMEKGIDFSEYIWSFVDHKPLVNQFNKMSEVPAQTEISQKMSKALKKEGFKFVGPTITYAFMQATGMVNDHLLSCHLRK